jgi:cytoskeletal protein CcmA (bactofilin family)
MAKNDNAETIVASGMRIDGELKSPGSVRIDGMVSGKVHSGGDVVIGPTAKIEADVIAINATIAGSVKGNITIKNSLLLTQTAHVLGNINCAQFGIEAGAFFSGQCRMVENQNQEARSKNGPELIS